MKIGAKKAVADLAGWAVQPEERDAIAKSYKFDSFIDVISFMVKIGFEAERLNHHPEWFNVYNKLDIVLTTHDAQGVTAKDVELAQLIDVHYERSRNA